MENIWGKLSEYNSLTFKNKYENGKRTLRRPTSTKRKWSMSTGRDVGVKWQPALWPCLPSRHHLIVNKFSSLSEQNYVLIMSGRQNNKLPNNLPQLQNLIKRDPQSYGDEVSVFG